MAILATSAHNTAPFRLFFAVSVLGHVVAAAVVFAMNSSLYRGPTAASTHSIDTIAVIFEPETQTAIKPQSIRSQNEPRHLISNAPNWVKADVVLPLERTVINTARLAPRPAMSPAALSVLPKPRQKQTVTKTDANPTNTAPQPIAALQTAAAPAPHDRDHDADATASMRKTASPAQQSETPRLDASPKTQQSAKPPTAVKAAYVQDADVTKTADVNNATHSKQAHYVSQTADTSGHIPTQLLRDWGTKVRDRLAHLSDLIDGYGRIKVSLEILPSGSLKDVHIIESSGNKNYDYQVVDNIKKVNIFPALGVNHINQPVLFPITITKRL
jgi:TonB family protein